MQTTITRMRRGQESKEDVSTPHSTDVEPDFAHQRGDVVLQILEAKRIKFKLFI
jgi:hypothetical protein